MTTNVAAAIEAVTALLQSPEAWCQRASARDAAGQSVPPESPEACSWCLRGAIARVGGDEAVADHLVSVLQTEFGRPGLIELAQFNDGRFTTHADVLAVLCAGPADSVETTVAAAPTTPASIISTCASSITPPRIRVPRGHRAEWLTER